MAGVDFAAARLGPLGTTYAMWCVYIAMGEQCDVHDTNNECTHALHLSTTLCRSMASDIGPLVRDRLVEFLGR